MKPQTQFYILTSLLFGILFYGQSAGINYLIFSVAVCIFSAIMLKGIWKNTQWVVAASGYIIASFFTFYYGNALSITMSILSFLMLMVIQHSASTSFFSSLIIAVFKVFSSIIIIFYDFIIRLGKVEEKQAFKPKKKIIGIAVVIVVTLIFLSLYRSINPVFDDFFTQFFIDIEWGWLSFFLLGLIIFYCFFFPPKFLIKMQIFESKFANNIIQSKLKEHENTSIGKAISLQNEIFTGILLLSILNVLILFLNITDYNFIFLKSELPKGITYSDYVHNGVGAIIFTIICTITIISFFFRSHLNFKSQAKPIKILAYVWIVQNIILIIMAASKNELYIQEYMLTYKRIGVYFYLAFAAIGLILVAYKVYSKKDFWVLFKQGSMIFFIVLIIACSFNWSRIVTNYNITKGENIDYLYLSDLNFENYPLLYENDKLTDSYFRNKFKLNFGGEEKYYHINWRVGSFLENYEEDGIFSYNIGKQKVYNYFKELANSGKIVGKTYEETLISNYDEEIEVNKVIEEENEDSIAIEVQTQEGSTLNTISHEK